MNGRARRLRAWTTTLALVIGAALPAALPGTGAAGSAGAGAPMSPGASAPMSPGAAAPIFPVAVRADEPTIAFTAISTPLPDNSATDRTITFTVTIAAGDEDVTGASLEHTPSRDHAQLGIAELGGDTDHWPFRCPLWVFDEEIVDGDVKLGREGVQVRVHALCPSGSGSVEAP